MYDSIIVFVPQDLSVSLLNGVSFLFFRLYVYSNQRIQSVIGG